MNNAARARSAPPIGEALVASTRRMLDSAQRKCGTDIHGARKHCKKLRAMARLVRPAVPKARKRLDRPVRDAARALSPHRDAQVRWETWCSLPSAVTTGPVADALRAQAEAATEPPAQAAETARDRLLRVASRIDKLDPESLSPKTIAKGFATTYRCARRAMAQCHTDPTAEHLHEWRKWVKYHGHQCQILERRVAGLGNRGRRCKRLWDTLGRHHDLQVLAQHLEEHWPGEAAVRAVIDDAADEQQRIEQRALVSGADLFAERPRDWRRVIRATLVSDAATA